MIQVRPSKCYRTHSSGSSVKTIISAPPKWPDPNLPAFKKLFGPGPMVVPKLLDNVRGALALSRQLEVGPAALDLELVVLAVGVRAPLALGVDVGDVAAPRVVLLVYGEVHHKTHFIGKVEGETVAGGPNQVRGIMRTFDLKEFFMKICADKIKGFTSCLDPRLLIYGCVLAPRVPRVCLVKLPRPIVPRETSEPK